MPVIRLALPLSIFSPQQIGDGGKPRGIAVLQNAQTLSRLIHRCPRCLQLQCGSLPVDMRLAYFEPQMLLSLSYLCIDLLLCCALPRKLCALAYG